MPAPRRPLSGGQMRISFLTLVFAAALVGGCTPMRWEHPAFGPDVAGREASECRQMAWAEAQRQAFMFGSFARRSFARDRYGRIQYMPFSDFHERQMMEMQLNDFCMRSKGFSLVPVG
jgi:hypothetical protein